MSATTTLDIRGTRIAFSDEGSGPLVVRAHGLTQSRLSEQSHGLIDWHALVDAGFRVVSYDARGHGDSGGTTDPGTYRWPSLAEDLLAVVDHLSPDEPVRAVGISMGTASIVTALTLAPERFAAVVLGAPPTVWETRAPQRAMYEQLAQAAESLSEQALLAAMAAAPVPPIFAGLPDWPGPPAICHELLPAVMRGAGSTDLPAPEAVARIETPSLVLSWATDPGHPVSSGERLAQLLPGSTLHVSETAADIRSWGTRAADFFNLAT